MILYVDRKSFDILPAREQMIDLKYQQANKQKA